MHMPRKPCETTKQKFVLQGVCVEENRRGYNMTITPDLRKQMDEMEQLSQLLGRLHSAHMANLVEIIMPPAPVRRRRWWEQLFLPKPTQKEDDWA